MDPTSGAGVASSPAWTRAMHEPTTTEAEMLAAAAEVMEQSQHAFLALFEDLLATLVRNGALPRAEVTAMRERAAAAARDLAGDPERAITAALLEAFAIVPSAGQRAGDEARPPARTLEPHRPA